jgi:hypothetical protein
VMLLTFYPRPAVCWMHLELIGKGSYGGSPRSGHRIWLSGIVSTLPPSVYHSACDFVLVENAPGLDSALRSDGMSPLLKISPALMQIENISLQSLVRSTRGLGVTDLREALEGRSMSNPNLAGPPSISTLDHTSSVFTGDLGLRLTRTRSRSRSRVKKASAPNAAGEVREVLTRLGIGKQNSNLLKSTLPVPNKPTT